MLPELYQVLNTWNSPNAPLSHRRLSQIADVLLPKMKFTRASSINQTSCHTGRSGDNRSTV